MLSYKEVVEAIRMLSQSQGFYGRLLAIINTMDEVDLNKFKRAIKDAELKDMVDLVLWLES